MAKLTEEEKAIYLKKLCDYLADRCESYKRQIDTGGDNIELMKNFIADCQVFRAEINNIMGYEDDPA